MATFTRINGVTRKTVFIEASMVAAGGSVVYGQ